MTVPFLLAIDPGPTMSGVVWYDPSARVVLDSNRAMPNADLRDGLRRRRWVSTLVLVERVQSYGIAGGDLLRTSEEVGRIGEAASGADYLVVLMPRRHVLRALDVSGKGSRDVLVRQRCIASHGGTKAAAVGTKAEPGPLHGVAGHAWQALGVALAWAEGAPSLRDHLTRWEPV